MISPSFKFFCFILQKQQSDLLYIPKFLFSSLLLILFLGSYDASFPRAFKQVLQVEGVEDFTQA